MMDYSFPLSSYHHVVERLDTVPPGVSPRRWVLRDDNEQHYHGTVSLLDDPLVLELSWKANSRARQQLVGLYRLHLARLLERGFVRRESDRPGETDIRLRFHRGDRGVVLIQQRNDAPGLAIGTVDRTLE